jgi:SAM-dependent methyltransferase
VEPVATTEPLPVDPLNAKQLDAWDGDEGRYWATHAEYFDRAMANYHQRLLEAATLRTTDQILDIGCGTGQATRDAARAAAAGSALGVDLSSQMVDVARRRAVAEGLANARFEQADAQVHPFDTAHFDRAISRAGAMFFGDPVVAFANIHRALRPGARLVLLTWQPLVRNEWIGAFMAAFAAGRDLPAPPPEAPGPFSLADPERVRSVLGQAGFDNISLEGVAGQTWFGNDADDAFGFVAGMLNWMLDGLDAASRAEASEALHRTLAAHETNAGVVYDSAAWIVEASRP